MVDNRIVCCETVLYKTKEGVLTSDLEHSAHEGPECGHKGPQLENVDELTARAFHALGRMMHVNRLIMAKMGTQQGTHHGEVIALALLSRGEGVSQRELGEVLHLSAPRVSIILDTLVKDGAVVRRADEADRRLTRVFLTPEGRRRVKEQRYALSDYVNRTIGALSEDDRRELTRLLGELADRTRAVLEEDTTAKARPEGEATR
jgi:DNA-binding MarR family transcriptional regulator